MIQVYCMCTVWGEPLSQTAQSFMPELLYGTNRSLAKVCGSEAIDLSSQVNSVDYFDFYNIEEHSANCQ